jgi:phage baseplate assembly protein W
MAVEIPHIRLPFTLLPGGGVNVFEEDSDQEVAQCVQTILVYPKGHRLDRPEFGISDPTFRTPHEAEIEQAIDDWELRARYTLDITQDPDNLAATIQVILEGTSNG